MKTLILVLSILIYIEAAAIGEVSDEVWPPISHGILQDLLKKVSEFSISFTITKGKNFDILQKGTQLPDESEPKVETGPKIIDCPTNYEQVESFCLYTDTQLTMHWDDARDYCLDQNSELVMFKDANEFASIIHYLKKISHGNKNVNYWTGARDVIQENHWISDDGTYLPLGSPFWGSTAGEAEPNGKRAHNCAIFYALEHFYLYDYPCTQFEDWLVAPVCQWRPPQ